jgi:Protein of unknown function (DUF2958)
MQLITDEQREIMLANDRRYREDSSFDPMPVIKMFSPIGAATWLLSSLDHEDPDMAAGLCDLEDIASVVIRPTVRASFRRMFGELSENGGGVAAPAVDSLAS